MMGVLGAGIGSTFAAIPGLIVHAVPGAETRQRARRRPGRPLPGLLPRQRLDRAGSGRSHPLRTCPAHRGRLHARAVDRRGNRCRRRRSRLDTPRSARTCSTGTRKRQPRTDREPLSHRTGARVVNAHERWNRSCRARPRRLRRRPPPRAGSGSLRADAAADGACPRSRPPRSRRPDEAPGPASTIRCRQPAAFPPWKCSRPADTPHLGSRRRLRSCEATRHRTSALGAV
jgi:hypothetical protein